ncbi:MAG: TOMM precursor leader peptide-binding protein [Tolypothrix brevis GSE-NOS-MK-07-07A]|jgi:bacteriocin biosynthesis cyclodehydratase domain-containing protein|nr:TOMM precursor leader peptide-binding protein [Tolypothrix brevis GSE-NOS-MK-07-07A]
MISKLHFKPSYAVETIEQDQVFFLSEREGILLNDRLSCCLAYLLQENHYNIDEILDIIQLEFLQEQKYSPENSDFFQNLLDVSIKTQYALFQMQQQGYLVEQDDSLPSHLAVFCHHLNIAPIPLGFLASTVQTALGMAVTEVFKWIVQGENQRLAGTLITYDTLTLKTQEHILVKRPQCPSCGEQIKGLESQPLPVVLEHRQKTFITDGGHRACSPQETLSKYQRITRNAGISENIFRLSLTVQPKR